MIAFLLALLVISALALAVLAAFALPNLRAGAQVLTPKGERVARRLDAAVRPLVQAVWPRLRPLLRRAASPAARLLRPVSQSLARRVRPVTEAFLKASFEGVTPAVPAGRAAPRTIVLPSASGAAGAVPSRTGASAASAASADAGEGDHRAVLAGAARHGA